MKQVYHIDPNMSSKTFVRGYFITKSTIVGYLSLFVVFLAYSVIELEIQFWIKTTIGIILALFATHMLNSTSNYMVEDSPHFILNEIKRISKRKLLSKKNKKEFFGVPECNLIFNDTDFLLKIYQKAIELNREFLSDLDDKKYDRDKLFTLQHKLNQTIELLELVKKINRIP